MGVVKKCVWTSAFEVTFRYGGSESGSHEKREMFIVVDVGIKSLHDVSVVDKG